MSVEDSNIIIKKLNSDDLPTFVKVIRLFEDVFEMNDFSIPSSAHLQKLLQKEDFIVFCALEEGEVIGGMTAYTLDQYYSTRPLAYIYDLAVHVQRQRQGIGGKLLAEIRSYCQSKGFEEVYVQADKADDYALDFYRKTNPSEEEDVSHFYYLLNK